VTRDEAEAVLDQISALQGERLQPGYALPSGLSPHVDGVVEVPGGYGVAFWTGEADEWVVSRLWRVFVQRRDVDGHVLDELHTAWFDGSAWCSDSPGCPDWVPLLAQRLWPEGE